MVLQRVIQSVSLALFLAALWCSPYALLPIWPADGFLRMDPIIFIGTAVADRELTPILWIPGMILLLGIFLGRFFCAYLCPMGTTIDFSDHLLRSHRNSRNTIGNISSSPISSKRFKFHMLYFILGAGVLGISFVFIASPLSLITRFYGLIIYPVLAFLTDLGLIVLRPVADKMDLTAIAYAVVRVPRYDLQWVTFIILLAIFASGLWSRRFWCRYLCPSGALLSLLTRQPTLRRQVSQDCTQCGLCVNRCPMGAIGGDINSISTENPFVTNHAECIACLACLRVCPTRAVSFTYGPKPKSKEYPSIAIKVSRDRRRILGAGMFGAVAAIITLTGLKTSRSDPGPGNIVYPAMIRPPGAVPENDFLARCIRCSACLTACPTNTLQPLGIEAGLSALFSPVITPRRGPCEPNCNACGRVCPTGALPPLSLAEKQNAKVGTARIFRQKCLAWELDKKCLICDEVCPFDAIEFRKLPVMRIAVPFVNENKCAGCGYCEHHCPVQAFPAIVVEPMLALRLSKGSYRAAAKEKGYSLEIRKKIGSVSYPDSKNVLPSQLDGKGLPPGFTE